MKIYTVGTSQQAENSHISSVLVHKCMLGFLWSMLLMWSSVQKQWFSLFDHRATSTDVILVWSFFSKILGYSQNVALSGLFKAICTNKKEAELNINNPDHILHDFSFESSHSTISHCCMTFCAIYFSFEKALSYSEASIQTQPQRAVRAHWMERDWVLTSDPYFSLGFTFWSWHFTALKVRKETCSTVIYSFFHSGFLKSVHW